MKETSPNWLQRRLLDGAYHYLLQGKVPITDLGKAFFSVMIDKVKNGELTPFSEYFGVLGGFKFSIEGLNFLVSLKGKNALFLENHTTNGPVRGGHWKLFATNYVVKQITGKEIRWTFGQDKTTPIESFRGPATKSINAIPVREGNGTEGIRLMLKAFEDQESVGLYPEGNGRKELTKGDPRAGGIILLAARRNIPIIATAAWFEKGTCHLKFIPLNNEHIKNLASIPANKDTNRRDIVDYAMIKIATNLPFQLRGYYKDPQSPVPVK